jgi:hypothetical protein
MEKLPVNLLADKLNLLDKAHDYRFLLRLMGFALVVDMLLAAATGTNLWTFKWSDISARPGLLLLAVVAYGVVMTIGCPSRRTPRVARLSKSRWPNGLKTVVDGSQSFKLVGHVSR